VKAGLQRTAPWVLTGLVIALSWLALYVRVAEPGLEVGIADQRRYLSSARSLVDEGRMVMPTYRLDLGRTVEEPLTSFPPLTSWSYALPLLAGVPLEDVPTLLTLIAWPLLLVLLGAFTYRLSGNAVSTTFAVAIAAVTWPFLQIYTEVRSETLFLPLLVAAVLAADGLASQERPGSGRLALLATLTTMLVLSRYAGFFFLVALGAWWLVVRLKNGRGRSLPRELAWLAIPAVVLGAWLLRNTFLAHNPVGPILMRETLASVSRGDVWASFLVHGSWLPLPAVRPGAVWRAFGLPGAAVVTLVVATGVVLLLRRRDGWLARQLERSPSLPFLALYLLFLLVAPSFMRMRGLTERYMAVVLCLAQPLLVARLTFAAPRRLAHAFLALFLTLNVALAGAFTVRGGILGAPDLGGRPEVQMRRLLAGTPAWWVHRPPRSHDLRNHHPDVVRVLDSLPENTVVVSNVPALFVPRPLVNDDDAVSRWLQRGRCTPPESMVVIVLDWDAWSESEAPKIGLPPPSELNAAVREKCPHAEAVEVRHGTIYMLGRKETRVRQRDERTIQDEAAERYEAVRYASPGSRRYHDWWLDEMLAKAADARLDGDVLDNGCGVGVLLARLGDAHRACGSDLSYGMLRHARDDGGLGLVQADSTRLPFADGSFDVVFARALLHHLPEPDQGLAEIRRVLRPGGLAVLADTNRSLLSALPRIVAYRGDAFADDHRNFHRSEYLAAVGRHLEVDDVQFFGYLAYPFGFPDISPWVGKLTPPPRMLDALIRLDAFIARLPGLRTQSWGMMVSARRSA
jgi:SAM-dependent methyltransferase